MCRGTPAVLVLFFLPLLASCSGRVGVLTYNVENLFDDHDDGTEYAEYRGERWNGEQYRRKLSALGRVLRGASLGGADVLCLQEVESPRALRDLRDGQLRLFGYRYLVFVPQEGVPTNVACLSRIPIVRTRVHAVGRFDGLPLRHIVELQLEHRGHTLYLFNNHWKSKSGGPESTAPARARAAAVLVERIRQILSADPSAELLVAGDLNENLEEFEQAGARYRTATAPWTRRTELSRSDRKNPATLFVAPGRDQAGMQGECVVLYDPWYELTAAERGSLVYQGRWQTPDRILLSAGLCDADGLSYRVGSFRVVRRRHLVHPQSGFPRRWRASARGSDAGTSDHLPLLLFLNAR